jgi:hypothetical protein
MFSSSEEVLRFIAEEGVQQHHRLPLAAIPHPERHLADIDTVQLEAIEHEPHLPGRSSANRERKNHPAGHNDPLLQARLFSYLDTQLTRLGGPNFTQLPVNRPHCPVNDMLRDGMYQTPVHTGLASTAPTASTAASR